MSAFLELPPELRNRIYFAALGSEQPTCLIDRDGKKYSPGLLRTCKQIREEATDIYYNNTEFEIWIKGDDTRTAVKWLNSRPQRQLDLIRGLAFVLKVRALDCKRSAVDVVAAYGRNYNVRVFERFRERDIIALLPGWGWLLDAVAQRFACWPTRLHIRPEISTLPRFDGDIRRLSGRDRLRALVIRADVNRVAQDIAPSLRKELGRMLEARSHMLSFI